MHGAFPIAAPRRASFPAPGEVPEWLKGRAWKARVLGNWYRGFESLSLRIRDAPRTLVACDAVHCGTPPASVPMRLLLALALVALAGCAAPASLAPAPDPAAAILPAFAASAEAWNRADLAGHVAMYADSAAFMTGNGPLVGRERTAQTLERAFFRDGRPVQQLRFESIAVTRLGPAHALATGRFILSGGGEADRTGWFTTVWTYTDGAWRIIHDHSS